MCRSLRCDKLSSGEEGHDPPCPQNKVFADMPATRTAVPRYRSHAGPALFRQGFRPFFLAAGLWAAVAVPLWLTVFHGGLTVPTAFDPVAWHGHEMIFGFGCAVVAGFLRSEEHTSELQSLMRISYALFCL